MFRPAWLIRHRPTHDDGIRFETITLPDVPTVTRSQSRWDVRLALWNSDHWLIALILCAACASIGAAVWAYQSQSILLYGDAHSHLLIAHRVFDNVYPGLAQLGDVWLPLPQLIMLPLAWNDFFWRTGLAGTLTSMPCYLIASVYVFLTARRLTHDSRASFIGSLVFVINPNILYLQATPLSEPVLFATLAAASYYFVAWAQDEQLRDLIYSALATLLATIARYDGWALYLALLTMLVIICWRKRYPRDKALAYTILFGTLGGVGILLWFLWNLVIFGSPVAFLSGSFSSQAQAQAFIHNGDADTYHNLWQSLRTYSLATAETIGPLLLVLGVFAVILFLIRRRLSGDALAAGTILVPFAFYVAAFFLGQNVMYVPHANHPPYYIFNARYGAEMVAPAAVFIATLIASAQRWLPLARVVLLVAIIGQSVATSWGGAISLQDGQAGSSCYHSHPIATFLAQHYDGGRILIDQYHSQVDLSSANVAFHNEIYEGDGAVWNAALANPFAYVSWIIVVPRDLVSQHINTQSVTFLREYTPVAKDGGVPGATLWRRIGSPPWPNKPVPGNIVGPYVACDRAKEIPVAALPSAPRVFAPPSNTSPIYHRPWGIAARSSRLEMEPVYL
ncbi:MAG TPA: glycosyltransferase family 39 protein [Ktedonobacterales bacterium]|nr:glycosyltransferase family 39 protein [Ktedonobacterales bacterium]